jgi:rod shape-determining protein MreB
MSIDLGTANTLVYVAGQGIVLDEPSVVAMVQDRGSYIPYAFGDEAKKMLGRTPSDIIATKPLADGVIAEFKPAEEMIKHFISTVHKKRSFFARPRIIICVPHSSTTVERRAIQDAALSAGAQEVFLIFEPMAAAIGANLPVSEPTGSMVVDIGGGTTEVGLLSLGGIVTADSVRVGGNTFDEAIMNYIRKNNNLHIGEATAERIKKEIGSALVTNSENHSFAVKGLDAIAGIPKEIILTDKTICKSLKEPVSQIVEAVKSVLEKAPPEIASDITESGITMTGGGALLKNLDTVIKEATGLHVTIAEDPLTCVVNGTGKVIENFHKFEHLLFKQD